MPYKITKNNDGSFKVSHRDTGKIFAYKTKDPKKLIQAIEINKKKEPKDDNQIYLLEFKKSDRDGKKYMVKLLKNNKQKTIHFGSEGMSDFTIHKDEDRKQRYINRHQKNENWNNPFTAGALSRWILWNKPTIQASLRDYLKRFNIKNKS